MVAALGTIPAVTATGTAPSDSAIAAVSAVTPDFLMLLMCDSAG